jgi:hypothetical protein
VIPIAIGTFVLLCGKKEIYLNTKEHKGKHKGSQSEKCNLFELYGRRILSYPSFLKLKSALIIIFTG